MVNFKKIVPLLYYFAYPLSETAEHNKNVKMDIVTN